MFLTVFHSSMFSFRFHCGASGYIHPYMVLQRFLAGAYVLYNSIGLCDAPSIAQANSSLCTYG